MQPQIEVVPGDGCFRGDRVRTGLGRVRECPVSDCKFIALGHNTVRGATGAAPRNRELMQAQGLL